MESNSTIMMMTVSGVLEPTSHIPITMDGTFELHQILQLIFLTLLTAIGLAGNLLVCVAILKTPKLHGKVVNYFVLSLAVSDLLVCILVMPLGIYQDTTGKWQLGSQVCYLWVLIDVLLCTASIWNLCLVAIDRYRAITKPIKYARVRTPRNAILSILSIWIISFVIAILIFLAVRDTNNIEGDALCQIHSKPIIGVISALAAFFLPSLVIVLLYGRIFTAIRRKATQRKSTTRNSIAHQAANLVRQQSSLSLNRINNIDIDVQENSKLSADSLSVSSSKPQHIPTPKRRWTFRRTDSIAIKREMKTAIVLAIVVLAFIGCWLPYFSIYLIMLWDSRTDTNLPMAFLVATWLGWCNSLINPIIYTIFNEDYRTVFKQLIFCGKL